MMQRRKYTHLKICSLFYSFVFVFLLTLLLLLQCHESPDIQKAFQGQCHGCTYFPLFFCILYGFIQ